MYMYDFLFSYLSQSQCTALHWASERGHHKIVQLLIEAGGDVNRLDEVSGSECSTAGPCSNVCYCNHS